MSTTTITYTPDPDHILARASKLAAAMQAQASSERPTTPGLRFDAASPRRPSDVSEKPPKSPKSPFRSLRNNSYTPRLSPRPIAGEDYLAPSPRSPALERASTAPSGPNQALGSDLFKTSSSETWPLRKSTDSQRPYDDGSSMPILSHEDVLVAASAREHAVSDSPLPTTPRLRNSTYMPDTRKLKWGHPDGGKFKPRPGNYNSSLRTMPISESPPPALPHKDTSLAPPPPLPPPMDSFDMPFRDSAKSTTTYVSSVNEISTTERSSTVTSRTSISDLLSPNIPLSRPSMESEISVEGYIELYAQGFEDDPTPPAEISPPILPNKPARSSPLSPRNEEKVPPVPKISIPPPSKKSFPEIGRNTPSASSERDSSISKPDSVLSHETPIIPRPSSSRTASSLATPSTTSNAPLPPMPPFASSGGRVTSAQLFAGDLPTDSTDLSFLEPPPDPNSDRYGFKKDNQYISMQQYEAWDQQYTVYLQRRRQKWDDLMRQQGLNTGKPTEFPPRSDKVKRFIRKGIPPEWRGPAWFWYAGGPERLARNKGLYKRLLEKCEEYTQLGDSDREHIERDLYRTFPDNDKFRRLPDDPNATRPGSFASTAAGSVESRYSSALVSHYERPMIGALRRVLRCFAVYNPRIGYCQSLNFLAGQLLLFLDGDEEKAFHLLCILTNDHLPGTHGVALEGANVDIGVLMATLKDREPQLWAKLDDRANEAGSPLSPNRTRQLPTVSLATTSWFMSCFVGSLPVEACCRVWDVLFYEGPKTLFRIALGIFRLGAEEIKGIRDSMEVFQVVQTLPRKMVDANALMEASFGRTLEGRGLLSQDTVKRRREERREVYASERRERQTLMRGRSGSAATEVTVASVSDDVSMTEAETPTTEKRRPSLSRGASLKRLSRWKSRKGKNNEEAPPMPGLPP